MLRIPLLTLTALAFSSLHAETEPVEIKGSTSEVYKTASGDDLLIYRLDPPNHDASKDKAPAIVLFFGGGWNGGAPTHLEPQGRYLAHRGMVVFLADYRVKKRQGTTPRECVADGKSAVRWVRENAIRFGINPDRIAAGGGSAGGHVAAATGMCEGLDEPGEETTVSAKPNALVLFNPVYNNGPEGGYGYDRVEEWFPAISPAHNITGDDPPAIVFLGTEDKLIPVAHAEAFQAEQRAFGVESELYLYEGEPHGFFNLSVGQGKKEHFIDSVLKTDAFLTSLGFLEGEPDPGFLDQIANGEVP
ncbi:MAG: alpha/beta hydrolase [Verrucomicrobiales bacterium]|nr:alpha/beta hydrolase [Verrucomicrobiales bacterium]